MLKRLTALFITSLLLLSASFSLADSFVLAGYDGDSSSPHTWESNDFFVRMEKRTGTTFTFQEYTDSDQWKSKKQEMLSGGELPDVLFKASLTTQDAIAFDEKGLLIDLLPLLPEYAPDLWALLQEHPDWLEAITLPSGHVVALPAINTIPSQNAMWLNADWLTALKLEAPTTLAELHDVLAAFKTRDPNQNGKADEVPLTFNGPWDLKFLSHAMGVAVNDYNLYTDESGTICFWPTEDSFFELAQTLSDWYQEGLLDSNGFTSTDTLRRITDDDDTLTYGMFFAPTPLSLVTYSMSKQFDVLDPLVSGNKQIYRDLIGPVTGGTFAITSACENPEELLSWVNILYTEEGAIEAMVGYENINWEWVVEEDASEEEKANANWNWVDASNMTSDALTALTVYDTGKMPWLYPQSFGLRYDEETAFHISDELLRLQQYVISPVAQTILTGDTRTRILEIQNTLGTYVDTVFARIILGEIELNEQTTEEIRKQMIAYGCEELVALYRSAQ